MVKDEDEIQSKQDIHVDDILHHEHMSIKRAQVIKTNIAG